VYRINRWGTDMADKENRNIRIIDNAGAVQSGALTVNIYSKDERLKRAAKMLLLCWLLALASVPILFAHFILVPLFLVAGPIMAYRRYHVMESVEAAHGKCPTCLKEINMPLDPGQRLPMWTYCPPSNDPIQLVEDPDGSR